MSLELRNVSKTLGAFCVKNISLEINRGEYVALMGPNGSGKSTLLQLLSALEEPDEGQLLLDSRKPDITFRNRVGIVFQMPEKQLFASTVKEDVLFSLRREKLSKEEKDEKARKTLALLGFDYDKIKDMSPFAFSGGEKRRLAIAGTLIKGYDYLLLDEPFSGLDSKYRSEFAKLLKDLKESGVGILLVTHSSSFASCAERLLVLSDGHLAYDGPPSLLYSKIESNKYGLRPCVSGEIASELRKRGYEIADSDTSNLINAILKGRGNAL